MTDLKNELAALIAEACGDWYRDEEEFVGHIAERLVSAFQPIRAWHDGEDELLYRFVPRVEQETEQ